MRPAVALLAILTTGALSGALADPPGEAPAATDPATQHEQMAACLRSDKNSTACRTAAETPAVAPAVAAAKPAPAASDDAVQERQLRNQGYKPTMVHGEEKYCRREAPLGSRLATVMHCVTLAEAEEMEREGRDTTERLQRSMLGCLTPAAGGCGH